MGLRVMRSTMPAISSRQTKIDFHGAIAQRTPQLGLKVSVRACRGAKVIGARNTDLA